MNVEVEHAHKMLESINLLRTSSEQFFGANQDSSVLDSLRFLATTVLNDRPQFQKPQAFTVDGDPSCFPFPSLDFAFFIRLLLEHPEMKGAIDQILKFLTQPVWGHNISSTPKSVAEIED